MEPFLLKVWPKRHDQGYDVIEPWHRPYLCTACAFIWNNTRSCFAVLRFTFQGLQFLLNEASQRRNLGPRSKPWSWPRLIVLRSGPCQFAWSSAGSVLPWLPREISTSFSYLSVQALILRGARSLSSHSINKIPISTYNIWGAGPWYSHKKPSRTVGIPGDHIQCVWITDLRSRQERGICNISLGSTCCSGHEV